MFPYVMMYGFENRSLKIAKRNMELRLSDDNMLRINLTQDRGRNKCLEICRRR